MIIKNWKVVEMNFKKKWQKLDYWKKGLFIGGLVGVIFSLVLIVHSLFSFSDSIERVLAAISLIIYSIFYVIFSMMIGAGSGALVKRKALAGAGALVGFGAGSLFAILNFYLLSSISPTTTKISNTLLYIPSYITKQLLTKNLGSSESDLILNFLLILIISIIIFIFIGLLTGSIINKIKYGNK